MSSLGERGPSRGFFMPPSDRGNISNGSQSFRTAPSKVTSTSSDQRASAPYLPTASRTTSNGQRTTSASAINFARSGSASSSSEDAMLSGSVPSSVPKSGRRRESISTQMRKLMTDSPVAAAGGGLQFQRSMGQTIAPILAGSRPDKAGLSTSLGSIGDILSTSSRTLSSEQTAAPGKPERPGHTHFGQECFVDGKRRGSMSSVATDLDDDRSSVGGVGSSEGRGHTLHRCEACNKIYRHPSCLIKHRWEHTVYWKEASKFLLSKHQQVQLLEAAAVLIGMDAGARSLPEEKALWPAAVSPASSGLLGSDKINFDTLMAMKNAARKGMRSGSDHDTATRTSRSSMQPSSTSDRRSASISSMPAYATSLPASHALSLSPLRTRNAPSFGRYSSGRNGDVTSLRLDESAERSQREESQETNDLNAAEEYDDDAYAYDDEEQDENMTGSTSISAGSPSPRDANDAERTTGKDMTAGDRASRDQYGAGAGGDVLADLDMELDGAS